MYRLRALGTRLPAVACSRPTPSFFINSHVHTARYQCRQLASAADSATGDPFWRAVPQWKDVSNAEFMSYRWQVRNTIGNKDKLETFLKQALPEVLTPSKDPRLSEIVTREKFIKDAMLGLENAPMAIRLTPYTLSRVNWKNAIDDPIRRQFIPLNSCFVDDHEKLTLDSLHEESDSPVPGLVHRYPDKALMLATSICPTYCRFCTRSYAVGDDTSTVEKKRQKPSRRRWDVIYQHLEKTPQITDVVVSGGDTYQLEPHLLREIAYRLLSIGHIRRVRLASKGLAVLPNRIIDPHDDWTQTLIDISNEGRRLGKHVCLHTHFDHPDEISWITKAAARRLFENNVVVRNQTVLLKGVNDSPETMGRLIRELSDLNIWPYYVYQCDMVRGIEDLRTPLGVLLDIEQQLRGTIAGFAMPQFVVDLPGGGGKRLASTYRTYDQETGVSTFQAPGLNGEKGQKLYEYYDPKPVQAL
ncbi:kama family protein [Aaosphaeria arxii CBS 175.79]|uniref:Kama family protein n=1 Tax=Aaosphaeria arxii CBS 175.79 TaxID=1450172 RepID=A0A6A5XVK4_9PLEO|nr:kama family protein [Aaosphaeria arxii CBS 175.79]KAF2016973.1 kama family protein [Aaosphaeria arxii CBS 175.79]